MPKKLILGALVAAWFALPAFAQLQWSDITPVNSDAAVDGPHFSDLAPVFDTDNEGTWIALWENQDIGASPTSSAVYFARSTNNGETWAGRLRIAGTESNGSEQSPSVAYAGGVWIAAWVAIETVTKGSADSDIWYSRSINGGVTWSPVDRLATDGATDGDTESAPHIAGDNGGNWLAIWNRFDGVSTSQLLSSTSVDAGQTWGPPVTVSAGNRSSGQVIPLGGGVWLVVTTFDPGNASPEIQFSRSDDNGATWSPFVALSQDDPQQVEFQPSSPRAAADKNGNVVATWLVKERTANQIPTSDPFYAISRDAGVTWTSQQSLITDPTALQSDPGSLSIDTDGEDNWVILWRTTKDFGGPGTSNTDLYFAQSVDDGQQWSEPAVANPFWEINGTVDETQASVRADERGTWLMGFAATNTNFGTPPNTVDWDVFSAKATEVGYLRGTVTRTGTNVPIGSCAIRIANESLNVERIAVTDLQGAYVVPNLPPGTYSLEFFASEIDGNDVALGSASADIATGHVFKRDISLSPQPLVNAVRGTVFGQVTPGSSVNRVPLVGVRVGLFPLVSPKGDPEMPLAITYSAGDGTYALNDAAVKGLDVQVRVNFDALGFVNDDRLPAIPPGGIAESNPTLEQKDIGFAATLAGLVTDASTSNPIIGALVELNGPVRVSRTTQLGGDGAYVFDSLPAAAYTVRTSAEGYQTSIQSIGVAKGAPIGNNIALEPVAGDSDPADIDGDNVVNAIDVQLVINAALGISLNGLDADVNGDNEVNAVDIQVVINTVLGV